MERRHVAALRAATWLYPIVLVASFYVVWLTAWLELGHRPIPSLDDPSQISLAVDVVYYGSGILLIAVPLAIGGGIATFLDQALKTDRPRRLAFDLGLYTALWVAAWCCLRWDPCRIIAWYMD